MAAIATHRNWNAIGHNDIITWVAIATCRNWNAVEVSYRWTCSCFMRDIGCNSVVKALAASPGFTSRWLAAFYWNVFLTTEE